MRKFSLNKYTKISDLNIYKKRIKKINLKWVQQIVKIIESRIRKKKIFLNDLGCNTFQLYKGLKNAKLNTIHGRLKGCMKNIRATPYKEGGDEFKALELYVASRSNGLTIETPSVRN